jgi:CheY-like chemotaxis protein
VNQKVLSRILTRAGITQLTIVDNGKKAVDLTETEQFDIIFMDMQVRQSESAMPRKMLY